MESKGRRFSINIRVIINYAFVKEKIYFIKHVKTIIFTFAFRAYEVMYFFNFLKFVYSSKNFNFIKNLFENLDERFKEHIPKKNHLLIFGIKNYK